MTGASRIASAPRLLALKIVGGGLCAAAAVIALSGQRLDEWTPIAVPAPGFWTRCGASLVVLMIALLLATCTGMAVEMLTRGWSGLFRKALAFCGRALACMPVPALAWGFVGLWIGRYGGPVETLMPAELPVETNVWQTQVARIAWEFLVPTLLLAIPLTGEMLHRLLCGMALTDPLDLALRARGVSAAARLWHHHLPRLLPVAAAQARALCLIAPIYLIVIEDVLRFMGWGGWMAQCIRNPEAGGLVEALAGGGCLIALLMGTARLATRRFPSAEDKFASLSWQPWLLWAMVWLSVMPQILPPSVVLWFAVLLAGTAGWHRAWRNLEESLPVLAARSLGGTGAGVWWRHLARPQMRFLAAWIAEALAQSLLWITLACSLRADWIEDLSPSLAQWIAPLAVTTSEQAAGVLSNPLPVLEAGGVIALASLCLIQVSRIILPRAH